MTGQLNLPALPEQDKAEEENDTEIDYPEEEHMEDSEETSEDGSESDQNNGSVAQEGKDAESDASVDVSCDPKMQEIWRQRILETAQAYEMMHGSLPGDIVDVVQQFRESKIDYMQKLRRYLTMHSGGEAQWLPPARRFVWQKMYLPSRNNGALEAVVALDTSGSTRWYLKNLTVIQCDAEVTDVKEYTENCRAPKYMQATGGGGTSFIPVFEYIKEKKLHPQVMLYFTDGYGDAPKTAPPYPVIWVLTPDGTKPSKWGEVIQLDENECHLMDDEC